MIKFFRLIRQQLLTDNKFSKYLLYAIGEIILVVIGILVALSLNNWNQNRIEIKKEINSLKNLSLDLEEQAALLDTYIMLESTFYNAGHQILKHYEKHKGFLKIDSILPNLNSLATRNTFNPINTTYEELIATGNIRIIQNETIKREIIRYYNALERTTLVITSNNTNLVDGIFNPVLFEQTLFTANSSASVGMASIQINLESVKELHATSEKIVLDPEKALHLFNVVKFRTNVAAGNMNRYEELQKETTVLLEAIALELGKK